MMTEEALALLGRYTRLLSLEEAGIYTARHPELPGCRGQGGTPEEACASLREAAEMYLDALLASRLPLPAPWVLCGEAW